MADGARQRGPRRMAHGTGHIAARDTIGQIVAIVLVTGAIAIGPFHHVVLGSTELLTAVLAGAGTSWQEYPHVTVWAAVGNTVGGAVFVAGLSYGQTVGEDIDPEEDR